MSMCEISVSLLKVFWYSYAIIEYIIGFGEVRHYEEDMAWYLELHSLAYPGQLQTAQSKTPEAGT